LVQESTRNRRPYGIWVKRNILLLCWLACSWRLLGSIDQVRKEDTRIQKEFSKMLQDGAAIPRLPWASTQVLTIMVF
jgi:hypothetical protein